MTFERWMALSCGDDGETARCGGEYDCLLTRPYLTYTWLPLRD